MDTKVCNSCRVERSHVFDGFNNRGDKVFRDDKGARWYNGVCAYCYYEKQRTCQHCGERLSKRPKMKLVQAS